MKHNARKTAVPSNCRVSLSRVICQPAGTRRSVLVAVALLALPAVAGAGTITFSNTNAIVINDSTNPPTIATPYGSPIVVTDLAGSVVTKLTVQLNNFAHTFPDDVDIVLVGPRGQNVVLMSNVGGGHSVTNLTLTLDDAAASPLPLSGPLVSGTFQPTQRLNFDFAFPAPAPASPSGPALTNFNGTEPDGTWNLFIVDDANPDAGIITGGWSLTLSTVPVILSITPADTNVLLSWTNAAPGYTLQMTTDLLNPAAWTNALPEPQEVSGQFMVTNAASANARFYRLMK
jgi:subtilisin-like proprotein convertase family protein